MTEAAAVEIEEQPYYYGSFYCAYKEDGSAFVWIPRWIRTETLPTDKAIKKIIKDCLEAAPLEERKYVGLSRLQHCKYIGLYSDDHDMRCVEFSIVTGSVSSGSEAYGKDGIRAAYNEAVKQLLAFSIKGGE